MPARHGDDHVADMPSPPRRGLETGVTIATALLCGAFAVAVFVPPPRGWLQGRATAVALSLPVLSILTVAAGAMAVRGGNPRRVGVADAAGLWAIALFAAVFTVAVALHSPWGPRRWAATLAPIVRLRSLFVVGSVAALLTVAMGQRNGRRRELILDFVCLCGAIEAGLVLVEWGLWRMGLRDAVASMPWKTAMFRVHDGVGFVPGSLRPTGTFGNPNITAAILAATFALALDRALPRYGRHRVQWGAYALAVTAILAVGAAQSRAAYLGCAVAVVVLLAARRHPGIRRALLLSLTLLVLLGVASRRRIASVRVTEQPAIQARLGVWSAAASIWTTQPITGIGIGRFSDAYAELPGVDNRADHIFPDAHSVWWTILAEQGVVGFVPLAIAVLAAAASAIRVGRRRSTPGHATAKTAGSASGVAGAVAALSVCFLFDNLVVSPAAAILFWILVGAALTANR